MAMRRKLSILAGILLALGASTAVWAYFTAIGSGTGSASISTLRSPSPVTASNPAQATVLVEWSMVVPPSGDQGDISYVVERSADDGSTFSPASGTCAGSVPGSATSCDDTLAIAGDYIYRVTAHFATWTSTGTSDEVNVVVDATAPTTSITVTPASPNGSAGWYKMIPSFTLSASDAGGTGVASTHYKIDAGPDQTYSVAVAIPEGQHTVGYWSVDNGGNVEATHTTATIKVDVAAPVTTIAVSPSSPNGSGGWYKTTAPTFTLTASDAVGGNSGPNASFYQIDGGAQQTYSSAVTIADGQHTITHWSQDIAGNVESSHTTATVKVDTAGPTLNVKTTAPATAGRVFGAGVSGSTVYFRNCPAGSYGFRFVTTVTDGTSGSASATYPALSATRWTTHASQSVTTPSAGPYTSSDFLWSPNNCEGGVAGTPGNYTITATDVAGNSAATTLTFSSDTASPTVTNVTLNNTTSGQPQGWMSSYDYVDVTYSEVMDAASFCSLWTNGSVQALSTGVSVTVSPDNVLTVSATGCTFHFGSVALGANYTGGYYPSYFIGSSLTWDPSLKRLRIDMGQFYSGGSLYVGSTTPSYSNTGSTRETDLAQTPIPTSIFTGTASGF
jgi:hypothetical protein